MGAGFLHLGGGPAHLVGALHRAGSRDHREPPPADPGAPDFDDGVVGMDFPAHQLVWGQDRLDAFDQGIAVEVEAFQGAFVAQRPQNDPLLPRHVERPEAEGGDPLHQFLGVLLGGVRLQYDDHLGSKYGKQKTHRSVGLGKPACFRIAATRTPSHRGSCRARTTTPAAGMRDSCEGESLPAASFCQAPSPDSGLRTPDSEL